MTKQRKSRYHSRAKPKQRSIVEEDGGKFYPKITRSEVISQTLIPPLRTVQITKQVFRFKFNNGVPVSTNFTTVACMQLYCIARGGSATPLPIYSNMRLKWIKIWQPCATADIGSVPEADVYLEFAAINAYGYGGAPRITHTASVASTSKYAYLKAVPSSKELAGQWFDNSQNYNLWNMVLGTDAIMDICFDCVINNDSTPVLPTGAVTSLAAGTVGVTNFAYASVAASGCRSIGLVNLINP